MPDDISSNPRAIADTLRKEITDGTWKAGTVRSIGDLARRFTTTRHYINTAVKRLRDSGAVDTRSGGGGGITPHGTIPPRWDSPDRNAIHTKVRTRIGDGTYPIGGPLPSLATLSREFGVARSTVYVSLAPLRDEGIVAVLGGRTSVVKGSASQAGKSHHPAAENRDTAAEPQRRLDSA